MLQPAGMRRDVIDESMQLLDALKLADIATRASPSCPTADSGWSSLRSRSDSKPEVLLLDEPAAGVPSAESHIILDAIDALPKHIGVLIIEHDMDLVFRFAERITVLVRRRGVRRRHAAGDRRQPARARRLSRAGRPWLKRARAETPSSSRASRPATARPWCWRTSTSRSSPARCISVIGRNGVGKTTLLATIMGHTTLHKGECCWPARSLNRVPIYRRAAAGLGFVPQEREIFPSLSVRENLEVGARPGRWTQERVFELFPQSARSGSTTAATSSPAASSRCCRSRARCSPIRRVLLMDEPTEGLAPVIVEALTAVLVKLRAKAGCRSSWSSRTAAWRSTSPIARVVMDKGRIVYDGASAALRDDPERLAKVIGVGIV